MLDKLPEHFLIEVCSSPILEVSDRLNLMLTCKCLNTAVGKCWGRVRRLRIANNESDDDRISDRFVAYYILKSASSLTSITLCLNSSINSQLCKGLTLFENLRSCVALRELTLLLTQLSQRCLHLGLCKLAGLSLRKLALVNSVADATIMRVICNTQSATLKSLGLINCFYLGDDALEPIIETIHIRTLNIRSSRRITTAAIQRLIDAHQKSKVKEPLKLYLFRSSVDIPSLKYEPGRVRFFDEKCWRKRLRTGEFLHETAVRPDWEYSSDEDEFV
uniref:F-box domain-containing protein n=1 Tax=Syphacia muris TaxID=451379 RepID=A0A0N5A9J2_9BILA